MGLFSSKKVVVVNTSVSRVFEDGKVPNALKSGVIKGLLTDNGEQLTENIMEQIVSSIGSLCDRAYRYGKREYVNGLPVSTFVNTHQGKDIAQDIIDTLAGRSVTMGYYHFGGLNIQHIGWQHLVDTYGYEQGTNELTDLSTIKGFKVFLEDFQVVVKDMTPEEMDRGSLAQWGYAATAGPTPVRRPTPAGGQVSPYISSSAKPTPILVDPAAEGDYFICKYIWKDSATKQIYRESLTFPMPVMDQEVNYCQIMYFYSDPDTPGTFNSVIPGMKYIRYFTYQEGQGDYPELDELFSPQFNDLGSFYPFGYFRMGKKNLADETDQSQYLQSKKLLKILKLPYDTIADAINENPDIKDVDSAMLLMATPADSTNPVDQAYLFEFFHRMYLQTGAIAAELPVGNLAYRMPFSTGAVQKAPKISIIIQDAKFKMAVAATSLRRFTHVGSIGAVGFCTGTLGTETVTGSYEVSSEEGSYSTPVSWQVEYRSYKKQVSLNLYEEIRVYDLQTSYYVQGKYAATQKEGHTENLLIPLDSSITDEFSLKDREELFGRGLHYVFNAIKIYKVKWFQQGWFGDLIKIVGIAWTIFTLGTDGGSVLAILTSIANAVVISFAIKLFVKIVGADFAIFAALVMAAYAMYDAYQFGAFKGAPWAEDLLKLSAGLMKGAADFYNEALAGIQVESQKFGLEMERKNEELERAESLLDRDGFLEPWVIFGEEPHDYYQRTVHSGNIGVASIDMLSSYADMALTLPKLSQTISFDQPMMA